jgi:Glycosyltransferase family 87
MSNTYLAMMMFVTLLLICFVAPVQSLPADPPQSSVDIFPGDFLEYWASARLLLTGNNPYSPEEHLALQRSVVSNIERPLMMWNPPWTLFFLLPLGLVSFSVGHILWSVSLLICLLVCSAHLWRIYGGQPDRYRIAWLICFSVVPTYLTLYVKQIDPLVLLGIVGFLHFQQHKQCWLAGLSLTLAAIKPHLTYLFWAALILWILENRQWRVFFGGAVGGMIATITPLILMPDVFDHYFQLYSTNAAPRPFDWKTPTLSTALALVVGLENTWVRYIPPAIGLLWFTFYWRKQRIDWNWTEQMPLLLLVSQATTIFAWAWDQIVLLPALICGAVWAYHGGRRRMIAAGLLGFLIINLAPLLVMGGVLIPGGFWLFWMVPFFLFAYLALRTQMQPITVDVLRTSGDAAHLTQ